MTSFLRLIADYRAVMVLFAGLFLVPAGIGRIDLNGFPIINLSTGNRVICAAVGAVFLLVFLFSVMRSSPTDRPTPYSLAGEWDVILKKSDQSQRRGSATITQLRGSELLDMSMQTESRSRGPGRFYILSATGRLKGSRVYMFYDAPQGDKGVYLGDLQTPKPNSFVVTYADIIDTNNDPKGEIEFTRRSHSTS